ncbi:MAG: NAD(P)-binding protein [Euryarchaeota archaeon]|nr:NAD(P)-binding protein [Euryarchaeota archaeon]
MKVAVVGAGIAGLAVAIGLENAGHEVTVYEASDGVGGRMSTVACGDYPIDVGFHVLHTAYPTVKRWIDLDELDAKPMDPCTVSIDPRSGRKRIMGDALKAPRYLLPTLKAVGIRDGLRFFKWRMQTSSKDLERSMDHAAPTISAGLQQRRFRPSTQRVLKPLFAGITLDPSLSERFSFADFTWGAMAHGTMVVPKKGIAAVPQQLAQRLKSATLHLNVKVDSVSQHTVEANGERHEFDRVILATPQHVAAELLPGYSPKHQSVERLTSTLVFSAGASPFRQARLLLNERWGEQHQKVLHVHVPTNLHPSPTGQHFVTATLVGEDAINPQIEEIQKELISWFGQGVQGWKHVLTTTVRHALPHMDPNHHARFLPDVEVDGVFLIGDHRAHPSVQGALASAERLLERFEIPLPRR